MNEARKVLPSSRMPAPSHQPANETDAGLWQAYSPKSRKHRRFRGQEYVPGAVHVIREASDDELREEAADLLRRRYQWRGYDVQPKSADMPSHRELVSLSTATGQVTGTLTITVDGSNGLAADQLYPAEVGALRRQGLVLCEGMRFAADGATSPLTVLPALFHVAFIWAYRLQGCTNLLIEVTPRHAAFYRRMLGFEVLGRECLNPRVNTTGVLLQLDFLLAADRINQLRRNAIVAGGLYEHSLSDASERVVLNRLLCGSPVLAYLP
jgi:hypothetical protein